MYSNMVVVKIAMFLAVLFSLAANKSLENRISITSNNCNFMETTLQRDRLKLYFDDRSDLWKSGW